MVNMTKNSVDSSVAERRLRPIYDWLDNGNNKKALQECDKVLRKTPKLQCARALKALTLHRMGKDTDSLAVLNELTLENPTDESTLQAMTLCYREKQDLEQVCKIYEAAAKADPLNEELQTQLFMSFVRVSDFKSQQMVAMTLYKHKPKNPYYCWAVMSIILQATRGEGQTDLKKKALLLSLAERMMDKLIQDGKLEAEQEVQLYVMVLELQGKYYEILQILDEPLGAKLACTNIPQNKLMYLTKLELWDQIVVLCKNILLENMDRWDIWKQYIQAVLHLWNSKDKELQQVNNESHGESETVDDTPEKAHEFICRIVENGSSNSFLLRGPYLARFQLCVKMKEQGVDTTELLGDSIELFTEYFRKFGYKPCCVSDLRIFLTLLTPDKRLELSKRLLQDVRMTCSEGPESEHQMQRHISALQLSRLCGSQEQENLPKEISSLSAHYENSYVKFGKSCLPTDLGPSDPYALLAAHVLHDLARTEHDANWLVAGVILLDKLLANSPSNFQAKLLGLKFNHLIGNVLGANQLYNNLDVKHLQLDSLGYIHCAQLMTSGIFSMCSNLFDTTLKFFSSNYKDSSDHLTFSYKYGSFLKLSEFMEFRERLNNSIHYVTTATDKIYLSLLECCTLEVLYSLDISPKDDEIRWENLRDNHDLSVVLSWDPIWITTTPELSVENKTFIKESTDFLKLRVSVLWCISSAVDVVKSTEETRKKHTENLENELQNWSNIYSTCNFPDEPQSLTYISLPGKSRLHCALATPTYQIVSKLFRYFLCISSENATKCNEILEELRKEYANLVGLVEKTVSIEVSDLFARKSCVEKLVNFVELLCISSLIIGLCRDVIRQSGGAATGKKHKKRPTTHTETTDSFRQTRDVLSNCLESVCDKVQTLNVSDTVDSVTKLLGSLNLCAELSDIEAIRNNCKQSFSAGIKELQNLLKNKIKFLASLDV